MVDLHFTYRDGPTRLCCELDGLKEDEITVVLEALQQRFDTVEQGAFSFSIMKKGDYSPLTKALRKRNGDLMDSGFNDEILPLMSALKVEFPPPKNDEQQRWMDVRCTAQVFNREINRLRKEMRSSPSILKQTTRDELLDRLAKIAPGLKIKKQQQDTVKAQGGSEKEPNAVEGEGKGDKKEEQPPALKHNELVILKTLAIFDSRTLATTKDVENEIPPAERISARAIQPAIRRLVELDLAERPEGDKHGVRLTIEGRRFASKIAD